MSYQVHVTPVQGPATHHPDGWQACISIPIVYGTELLRGVGPTPESAVAALAVAMTAFLGNRRA